MSKNMGDKAIFSKKVLALFHGFNSTLKTLNS
jgi:hypothetical protein